MRNNMIFRKFESIIVLVVMILLLCFFLFLILRMGDKQRLKNFINNAYNFEKAVLINLDSFHNDKRVYLREVIDEGFLKKIKNPIGKGFCSKEESYVDFDNGTSFVTLQCGHYLINHVRLDDISSIKLYKVGNWQDKRIDDAQSKVVYNCLDGDKELFDNYYDEFYFIYMINKTMGSEFYYANQVNTCTVVTKTVYRSIQQK